MKEIRIQPGTWRSHCSPIIKKVIDEVGKEDMKKLRKALRDAYPYGEKENWPYKVWLSEIQQQLHVRDPRPVVQIGWNDLPLFQLEGHDHHAS